MSQRVENQGSVARPKGHFTSRRGFVTGVGFGLVSLYGLWGVYGAAPTSLRFLSGGKGGGHGAMGDGGGIPPEEFRRRTEAFIKANELPDGSVTLPRPAARHRPDNGHEAIARHGAVGEDADGHQEEEITEVYLMASRYGYAPTMLRLEAGVPYRFRMMAVDANHGASINFRVAGRMIRCPARTLVQTDMTFTRPGEHLVYCTVYCGEGHDMMWGKIVVV